MRKPEKVRASPWLEKDVMEYMGSLLSKDSIVLETGSGGSTLWLSNRVRKVVSYEHEHVWHEVMKSEIGRQKAENIELVFDAGYPKKGIAHIEDGFDLLLVDGRGRVRTVETAHMLVKHGGYLVFDDSNRPRYKPAFNLLKKEGWKKVAEFSGDEGTQVWRKFR